MNRGRLGLSLILGLILVGLSLAPGGRPALAQSPDEVGCYPRKKVYLPLVSAVAYITGNVTYHGQAAGGVYVALYNMVAQPVAIQVVKTDAAGNYAFLNPPALPKDSAGYKVVFKNGEHGNLGDARYLAYWFSFPITALKVGAIAGGNFDIANVELASPETGASVTAPAVFTWTPRSTTSDSYEFDLEDGQGATAYHSDPRLGYTGSYTLESLPASVAADDPSVWLIMVYAPDGGYGASASREVSFRAGP